MRRDLYSARIGESTCIAENLSYEELIRRIIEFTIRAAIAQSKDESDWEQEELRRDGVASLQLFHNGRTVWDDPTDFETELECAQDGDNGEVFLSKNELDPGLYDRVERDLRDDWRSAGYHVPSLATDMKKLFIEIDRDLGNRFEEVQRHFLAEITNKPQENGEPAG